MTGKKKDKKIVVVEDEESIAKMYVDRLTREGYEVTLAGDGEKGIEIILATKPDFVLLDIMLPKKNGFEVLELVRKTPEVNSVPVIVLSAFQNPEYVERVNNFGANGFFNKAVTMPHEIAFMINKILFPEESFELF